MTSPTNPEPPAMAGHAIAEIAKDILAEWTPAVEASVNRSAEENGEAQLRRIALDNRVGIERCLEAVAAHADLKARCERAEAALLTIAEWDGVIKQLQYGHPFEAIDALKSITSCARSALSHKGPKT